MSSKNNPENRGKQTVLRTIAGKTVKPVLFIDGKNRYMAAMYESGELAMDKDTGLAIPYQNV